jgi:hypothetical protein
MGQFTLLKSVAAGSQQQLPDLLNGTNQGAIAPLFRKDNGFNLFQSLETVDGKQHYGDRIRGDEFLIGSLSDDDD